MSPVSTGIAPSRVASRIIEAALAQCEEVGLRRLTMEDVARRAGLGRATLYRHIDSKDALVRAVILSEAETFFRALDEAVAQLPTPDQRLVEGFAFALRYVRDHTLLNKLRRAEPETLLPYLIGGGELIAVATAAVAERIDSGDLQHDRESAELLFRLVLSLALAPESSLGSEDPDGARQIARRYLVPGFTGRTG